MVRAAHDINREEVADGLGGDAFELGDRVDTAGGCFCAVAAEGERADAGEENCVLGAGGEGEEGEGEDERQVLEEHDDLIELKSV